MATPCPYPDCPADARPSGPVPSHGVWTCPGCGRPSAACLRRIGPTECGALNRPVSSFCRRCGAALPAAWFADQTAAGLNVEDGHLSLGPIEPLYPFAEDLPPSARADYTNEVEPVGGWLGVGLPGGRMVLLDALGPNPRVHRRDSCWPADPNAPAVSGTWPMVAREPWLVTYLPDRLRVVNLLSGVARGGFPTVLAWRTPEGVRLLAPPVVIPRAAAPPGPSGALLAWAAGPPDGEPVLFLSELAPAAGDEPAVQAVPFGKLKIDGPFAGAALVAVPGPSPSVLVAGGRSLVLLASAEPGRLTRVAGAHDLQNLALRGTDRALGGLPTAAFLAYAGAGGGALGLAALACNDGNDLLLAPVATTALGVGRQVLAGAGCLLGAASQGGEPVFLTFDRFRLKAVNRLHTTRRVRELAGVDRIQWARVVGRLFAYTATHNVAGHCAGVIDLETGLALDEPEDPNREPPRPAVIGRHVFTVGWRAAGRKRSELWLSRRPLRFTDLPLAIEDDPA